MPRKRQPSFRRTAVEYHRHGSPLQLTGGIRQIYEFHEKAWWTDVVFLFAGYRVMLHWYHPRLAYEDRVYDGAGMENLDAGAVITPSLRSEWTRKGRFVSLCAPLEVRNHDDLAALVALARRLLKRETTLAAAFPGYVYGRADWLADTA